MNGMEAVIRDGVQLGEGVELRPPCIVGEPARGDTPGSVATWIGAGSIIRAFTVVYAGAKLGERVQTGHGALIREGNIVGDDSSIGSYAVLEGRCTIGARVRIHSRCFLSSVTVGDDVFVGPGVVFTDDPHPPCPKYVECGQGVVVEAGAKIGGGAIILPGVVVGRRALIGAGSVVTEDIPAEAVAVGNPARVIKNVHDLRCFAGLYSRVFEWEEVHDGGV